MGKENIPQQSIPTLFALAVLLLLGRSAWAAESAGYLRIVGEGEGEGLLHAIRLPAGPWRKFEKDPFPGDRPARDLQLVALGHELHWVALDDDKLLYVRRDAAGSWGAPESVAGGVSSACLGMAGDTLHLLAVTAAGGLRSYARGVGVWLPSEDVKSASGMPSLARLVRVRCAGSASILHVVVLADTGALYHTSLASGGSWAAYGMPPTGGGPATDFGVAADGRGNVHIVPISSDGLYHSLKPRFGPWVSAGRINKDPEDIAVAAAQLGDETHVVKLQSTGRVQHTVRRDDGTWFGWGDVTKPENAGVPAPLLSIAVAAESVQPRVLVSSSPSLNFGSSFVGLTGRLETPFRNLTGGTLNGLRARLSGEDAGAFSVAPPEIAALDAFDSATVSVRFTPRAPRPARATLVIGEGTFSTQVDLDGMGAIPPITASADHLVFPPTALGQSSQPQQVILYSSSQAALALSVLPPAGADFVVDSPLQFRVGPDAPASISARFVPRASGGRADVITLALAGGTTPLLQIELAGTASPPPNAAGCAVLYRQDHRAASWLLLALLGLTSLGGLAGRKRRRADSQPRHPPRSLPRSARQQ